MAIEGDRLDTILWMKWNDFSLSFFLSFFDARFAKSDNQRVRRIST